MARPPRSKKSRTRKGSAPIRAPRQVAKPDTAPDTSATEADASLEQLLQDFENLLRNDPGVDPGIREMMEQQVKGMMAGGPAPHRPPDAVLDPGCWSAPGDSLPQR